VHSDFVFRYLEEVGLLGISFVKAIVIALNCITMQPMHLIVSSLPVSAVFWLLGGVEDLRPKETKVEFRC
jgi:hypothetical protein